jgi:hypothetical protein
MSTFFGKRAFHQQHQKRKHNGEHRENQESVENFLFECSLQQGNDQDSFCSLTAVSPSSRKKSRHTLEPHIVRVPSGAAMVEEREFGGPWLKTVSAVSLTDENKARIERTSRRTRKSRWNCLAR